MKAILYASCLTALFVVGVSGSASAEDVKAACLANPPSGMPAQPANGPTPDQFCGCVDKETAGNEKLRGEFLASLKIKEFDKRNAALSDAGKAVIGKCGAAH